MRSASFSESGRQCGSQKRNVPSFGTLPTNLQSVPAARETPADHRRPIVAYLGQVTSAPRPSSQSSSRAICSRPDDSVSEKVLAFPELVLSRFGFLASPPYAGRTNPLHPSVSACDFCVAFPQHVDPLWRECNGTGVSPTRNEHFVTCFRDTL